MNYYKNLRYSHAVSGHSTEICNIVRECLDSIHETKRFVSARSVAKAIESTSLPFESIHDIGGEDGLALGVLRVRHCVPHHVLQEDTEHSSHLSNNGNKVMKIFTEQFRGNTGMLLLKLGRSENATSS